MFARPARKATCAKVTCKLTPAHTLIKLLGHLCAMSQAVISVSGRRNT